MSVDIEIPRGSDWAIQWRIFEADGTTLKSLSACELVFRATWRDGAIEKRSGDGDMQLDSPSTGLAAMPLSVPETRSVPFGRIARYELEIREGGRQLPLQYGWLIGIYDINPDD